MNTLDGPRIAALATRLEVTPQQLLALAVGIAEVPGDTLDGTRLDAQLARVRQAGEAAESAAALALVGYASYALDDIDHALALVWSETGCRGL